MRPFFEAPKKKEHKSNEPAAPGLKVVAGGAAGAGAAAGGAGGGVATGGSGRGPGGAPILRSRAEEVDRLTAGGKNDSDFLKFTDSPVTDTPAEIPRAENTQPKTEAEWMAHPEWPQRKRPLDKKGFWKNREEISYCLSKAQAPEPDDSEMQGNPLWQKPQSSAEIKKGECWTPAFKEYLLEWTGSGRTITDLARKLGIPYYRLNLWLQQDAEMAERLKAARAIGVDAMVEEALKTATNPVMTKETIEQYDGKGKLVSTAVKHFDNVYARKLAVNTRMLLAAKWMPDRYGEKPVAQETASQAEKILAARRRVMGLEDGKDSDHHS